MYLCCFCNWPLHINTELRSSSSNKNKKDNKNNNISSSSSQHVPNNNDIANKTRTSYLSTQKVASFPDVRGSKIRDVISPSLQYINTDTRSHANLFWSVGWCSWRRNTSVRAQRLDTVTLRGKTYVYLCTAFVNKAFVQQADKQRSGN
jgi:hypothetical protein